MLKINSVLPTAFRYCPARFRRVCGDGCQPAACWRETRVLGLTWVTGEAVLGFGLEKQLVLGLVWEKRLVLDLPWAGAGSGPGVLQRQHLQSHGTKPACCTFPGQGWLPWSARCQRLCWHSLSPSESLKGAMLNQGTALPQASWRSCGCCTPGDVQHLAGYTFEQPGLVAGIPAHGARVDDL